MSEGALRENVGIPSAVPPPAIIMRSISCFLTSSSSDIRVVNLIRKFELSELEEDWIIQADNCSHTKIIVSSED